MKPLPFSTHQTIVEIDAGRWNQLAGQCAFATHGWLLTVERSWRGGAKPVYFALWNGGNLIAGSVCYLVGPSSAGETLDDMLFGRVAPVFRALGVSYLPSLVCGPATGYGWHIGVHPDLDAEEADEARRQVLGAIEIEARRRNVEVSFTQVLDEEPELQRLLHQRGYLRCRNVPIAILDPKWDSFEGYMASLARKTRAEFQRQTNRNREAGCAVAIEEQPGDTEGRLLQLLDWNSEKHNGRPFSAGDGFFRELAHHLGTDVRVFTARKSGHVTGVVVVLLQGDSAFAIVAGVDPLAGSDDYTYFETVFNSPIAMALDSGKRLYYGRGMYELKLRRGCRLMESWVYANPSGAKRVASAAWFRLASQWNWYKLPPAARIALQKAAATRGTALDPGESSSVKRNRPVESR